MKIVFADSRIIDRGDMDWSGLTALGEFKNYRETSREDAPEHLAGSEAILVDSFPMDGEMMDLCPDLKFIGVAATGYNHIDLDAAKARGIAVANVPAYSTEAVAQHAVALLLTLAGRIDEYDRQVHRGLWNKEAGEAYEPLPITLLAGRSMGIIGWGNIGRRVGEIARALGMEVRRWREDPEGVRNADVISLHCPLTEENRGMIDEEFIASMKDGAILINTARGALVDEDALARALESGKLAGAGLDVMAEEPPASDSPLLATPRCILTPHIAFTPEEIRQRVVDVCGENLKAFLEGKELNRIL